MEDKRFEEQARQVMDDFNMEPSNQVWQNIYPAIQKNKKRRAAFWWFFGILIVLGTGISIFQFNKNNSAQSASSAKYDLSTATNPTKKELANASNNATLNANSDQTSLTTFSEHAETAAATTNEIAQINTNKLQPSSKIKGKKKGRYRANTSFVVADAISSDAPFNPAIAAEKKELLVALPETVEVGAINEENKKDSLLQQVEQSKEKAPATNTNPTTAKKQKSTWHIWAGLSGGINFVSNANNQLFAASTDNLGTTPGSTTGSNNISYTNNNITSGSAYQLAIEMQRQSANRLFVSAGLAYQYRSLKMATGNTIFSQPNLSFAPGNSQTFNARMHQLAIPVRFYWQMNSTKSRIPIYWNVGFTLGKTFHSTTLEYNNTTNSYTTKNNQVNNSFATLASGFFANISANKKRPIWLGIIGEYPLQPITQTGLLQNKKTIVAGISIRKQIF